MTYRGKPLLFWLDKHPSLRKGHGAHNPQYSEIQAAETFGLSPMEYAAKARLERNLMASYVFGKALMAAMQTYDAIEESKNKKP